MGRCVHCGGGDPDRPDFTTVRIVVAEAELADAISVATIQHPLTRHQGGKDRSEVVRDALAIGLAALARQYGVPAETADPK